MHVAIDDHSRIAFGELPGRNDGLCARFPARRSGLLRWLGIWFKAVLTDSGSAPRSFRFVAVCRALGLMYRCTRPCTPRTNCETDRFIEAVLREWAYGHTYQNSNERSQQFHSRLPINWHRPHASLGLSLSISRAVLEQNNLF